MGWNEQTGQWEGGQPWGSIFGGGSKTLPMSLEDLSDDQLLALAGQFGLNSQDFMVAPPAGITDFNQPISASPDIPQAIRDLVSREYGAVRQQGQRNVREAAIAAAGRRGLNMTDTPIFEPLTRSFAELESLLGGQEAASILSIGQD